MDGANTPFVPKSPPSLLGSCAQCPGGLAAAQDRSPAGAQLGCHPPRGDVGLRVAAPGGTWLRVRTAR